MGWIYYCSYTGVAPSGHYHPVEWPGKDKEFAIEDDCESYASFWKMFKMWTAFVVTTLIFLVVLFDVNAEYKEKKSAAGQTIDDEYQKLEGNQDGGNQIQ